MLLAFGFGTACSGGDPSRPVADSEASVSDPASIPVSAAAVPAVVEAVVKGSQPGRPVIFIGLDGADWTHLDAATAAGRMPHLASLVREGHDGVLLTEHPPLSPLLWTTMMTGASPLEHGILDFTRFQPDSGVKEPITSDERRVPAVWNMAGYGAKSVAVFGLWATYPAEPVNGLVVSDRLMTFLYQEDTPPPGVVYPPSREPWARERLRQAEDAVDLEALREYLPWLTAEEYAQHGTSDDPYGHPIGALRRILVETRVYHHLATEYLAEESPDLAIVYIQGSDTIGHMFASFAPPRQASVSKQDFERYAAVPELYFAALDKLLGEYRRLAEERGAVLVLASDHGFHWHEGRPQRLSSSGAATAAKWHRKEGVYLLWGPGIEPEVGNRPEAGLRQVAATLLGLLGLPPGRQVEGPSLPGADFRRVASVDYRSAYKRPKTVMADRGAPAAEEIAKLRALGYIGDDEPLASPDGSSRTPESFDNEAQVLESEGRSRSSLEAAAEATTRSAKARPAKARPAKARTATAPAGDDGNRTAGYYNNRALILRADGKRDEAVAAFEKALALDPNLASALWNLSDLLFAEAEDLDRSDRLLVRALAGGLPEGVKYLIGRAIGYGRNEQQQRSLDLLEAAVEARPGEAELWLFRGRYRIDGGDCGGALADFERAIVLAPERAPAYASVATARVCLGDRSGALTALERSLEIEPNQPAVQRFLEQLR